MMKQILEQKAELAVHATERSVNQLTSHQLDLATKVVAVLSPIEEVTKFISADVATIYHLLNFYPKPAISTKMILVSVQ